MSYEEFLDNPKLKEIFNLNRDRDIKFIQRRLLMFKPRANDMPGWIYVYYRKIDE